MQKTILITGATDGIGLEAAKRLAASGHHLLLHGRNPAKLEKAVEAVREGDGRVEEHLADLSRMDEVAALAAAVAAKHGQLDVLINNAGVFRASHPINADGLDVRFAVNTIAPFLLTRRLLPVLSESSRVVNLSSAAQAPVDLRALKGEVRLSDNAAYAQSKLALTMWSREMARSLAEGPMIVSVNPGSMLGTKMVKEAFGVAGGDVGIGADILYRASVSDEFEGASGKYFDNDSGRFAPPHPDGLDSTKSMAVVRAIEDVLGRLGIAA